MPTYSRSLVLPFTTDDFTLNFAPLVLADLDVQTLVWLSVVVITFLSWVVKQLKGGDAAGQPPAQRPADKPLRSEIEVFLKELTKGQPEPARKPPPPPQRKQAATAKAKAEKARKARAAEAAPSQSSRPKPGARVGEQHLPSSQLGQAVREHLTGYMTPDRVTAEAQQFIGHRIEQAVQSDLGQTAAAATTDPRGGHPLLALLNQPGGMRQALILNEILQKPAALRRKA